MTAPTTRTILRADDQILNVTPDGQFVSYVETSGNQQTLAVLDLTTLQSTVVATYTSFTYHFDDRPHADETFDSQTGFDGGALSANGKYIFYSTGVTGTNISNHPGDTRLYVQDVADGTPPVEVTPSIAVQGYDVIDLQALAVSNDGQTIVFEESDRASNLQGLFVETRGGGTFAINNVDEYERNSVHLTSDGQYLTYSFSGFVVVNLQDKTTTTYGNDTTLKSGALSDDGRYVVYAVVDYNDPNENSKQLYVHDTAAAGVDRLVSDSASGVAANGFVEFQALSGDGRHVLFESDATNLVGGVTDGETSLYLKNLDSGAITVVARDVAAHGYDSSTSGSNSYFISYDGSQIFAQTTGGVTVTQYAPPKLTVDPVSGDDLVNAKEPTVTVSGTSDAIGQTVHLSLEGTTVSGSALVRADGTWSTLLFIGAPKPDGVHTIDASVTDEFTATATHAFTVDTTPPSLTLYPIAGDNVVNAAEAPAFTIYGSASDGTMAADGTSDEAGQSVSLSVDNKAIGTATVQANGIWAFQANGTALADGQHELEFAVADKAGNVTQRSIYFDVDTTPPKIALTVGVNNVVDPDGYRNGTTVQGTSDAIGATVDVFVNYDEVHATVAADGTWTAATSFAGASSGSYSVTATVADAAGNVGTATTAALVENGIVEVSTTAAGVSGTGQDSNIGRFGQESLSGDGQVVAFVGLQPELSGLVPTTGDAASLAVTVQSVYVKTVSSGAITLASKTLDGAPADGDSWNPAVSQDGRFVAFLSDATNLVAGDTNGAGESTDPDVPTVGTDVFETDLSTGVTRRVDTTAAGGQVAGDSPDDVKHQVPAISADGRYVAFVSSAGGLVDGVTGTQIYLKDMTTGAVSLVSKDSTGAALAGDNLDPSISADGRYVVFSTTADVGYPDPDRRGSGFLAQDRNNDYRDPASDVFLRDMQTGDLTLLSSTVAGGTGNGASFAPVISPDGKFVAFDTYADDLGPSTADGIKTAIVNLSTRQITEIPGGFVSGGFAANDTMIAVIPREENDDFGTAELHNLTMGTTQVVVNAQNGVLSADGRYLAFDSAAPLTPSAQPNAYQGYSFSYLEDLRPAQTTFAPVHGDNKVHAYDAKAVPVSGTSDVPGGTVTIAVDGGTIGTTVVGSDDNWSTDVDLSAFDLGSYTLTATVVDLDGFTASAGEIVQIACYGAGTLIATKAGEVPVQALRVGDLLVTASGALRPVKWIGTRSYAGRFANANPGVLPICFKAGSLGEETPRRDLWVSPKHAMYLDGVLIPAEHLVNGVSIVQATSIERVDYFHIELDSHDVIVAEGALSETFVDDHSREMFHNAREFEALYPEAERFEALYCAPRVEDGFALEAVRRRLGVLAGLEVAPPDAGDLRGCIERTDGGRIVGWAQSAGKPDAPVCLDVLVDGRMIGHALAENYRDDLLASGIGTGWHGFAFRLPSGSAQVRPERIVVRRSADGACLMESAGRPRTAA